MAVGSLSRRAINKAIKNATKEQNEAAINAVKERTLVEEMGINPALAKQVVDGDITLDEARLSTANQNNKLGTGAQAEAVSDAGYINQIRAADPDGIKVFGIKQGLPEAEKNKLTMAEIAYKKGDPKPLATMYRTLGIAGAVGAGSATAGESGGFLQAETPSGKTVQSRLDELIDAGIPYDRLIAIAEQRFPNHFDQIKSYLTARVYGADFVPSYVPEEMEPNRRAGRFPEVEVSARRVDPTPPPLPELQEVTPTQRGQIPIPQKPQLEEVAVNAKRTPEPILTPDREMKSVPPRSEPRLESELASGQMSDMAPAPAIEVAHTEWVESGTLDGISNETQFERADTPSAREPETETQKAINKAIAEAGGGGDWDTQTEFAAKNAARTVAGGLTLGHADEAEGLVRSMFGTGSYEEEVAKIRQEMEEFNAVNPVSSTVLDIAPALATGGALLKAGTKAGYGAGRVGAAEGSVAGVGYAESPEEAIAGGVLGAGLGAFAGKSLDVVVDWSKKASGKMRSTIQGGRTPVDDEIDDGILIQTVEPNSTIYYNTNDGGVAKATVISVNKKTKEARVKVGDAEVTIPAEKIRQVKIETDKQISDYESLQEFDNARGQYKPRRQIEETRMTPEGEEVTVMRDATWRDARNAGELWDAMKDGAYRFYNEKLTGADDMLTRVVSKAVGSRFARASQNAVRYSTLAFTNIAEPLRKVAKLADDDRYFKAMVMDFTNARKLGKEGYDVPTQDQIENYIRQNLGEEDVKAFRDYMDWNRQQKARHVDKLNGRQAFKEHDHIHTQLNKQGKEKLFRGKKAEEKDAVEELEFALRDDNAMESRSRRSMMDLLNREDTPLPRDDFDIILTVDDYMNPFFTDFRRTTNLEALYQLARVFGIDTADGSFQPAQVFERIEKSLVDRGVEKSAAKLAADTMRDDFVGGSKTPNNWIQALNSVGYAGSLAGPKSAILNFHDVLQTMAVYGPKAFKGVAKDMGVDVDERGIKQNLGEFRNDMFEAYRSGEMEPSALARDYTRKGTDVLMKASGFAWTDTFGKNAVTKMIIQDAVDAVDGEGLAKKWGFYFSKRELGLIENQIKKHGTNVNNMTGEGAELMEELFFAGLGQQQLISSSGRPAAWSRNPDFRFMWALRGFAIKQQALAMRHVVENILEGNTKDAVDYMRRYVLFAAGGFGLINEFRQWLMGDGEASATGLLMGVGDQILSTASINTIGLNDYQWGRMMQNGVTLTFLESIVPIGIDVPKDMAMDVVDAIDGTVKGKEGLTVGQRIAYPVAQFPLVKQPSRLLSNLEDNTGLPNPMRQFTDMYIETEVPKDG